MYVLDDYLKMLIGARMWNLFLMFAKVGHTITTRGLDVMGPSIILKENYPTIHKG